MFRELRAIVHIAYFDESLSDVKDSPYALVGALVVPYRSFGALEGRARFADDFVRMTEYDEFHAVDLFRGENAFKDVPEGARFGVISSLLGGVRQLDMTFFYSAVDRRALRESGLLGSANPIDVGFNMCARGIDDWLAQSVERVDDPQSHHEKLCLFIFDDTKDHKLKADLKATFRLLRPRAQDRRVSPSGLWHIHDVMFFGD